MKYIIFAKKMKELTHLVPVIFPENMVHKDMANALSASEGLQGYSPIRAGFVSLGTTLTVAGITKTFPTATYGDSETLGLKSHSTDATLIDTYGYTGGMI